MKCKDHPKKDAAKTCVNCGNFYCDDCLTKVKNRNYCKDCMGELLAEKESSEKEEKQTAQPQIIIQQQQQQQQGASDTSKRRGSWFWLCFWIVIFFPIAIIYALTRRWD